MEHAQGVSAAHRSWMSPSLVRSGAVSARPAVVTANHESTSRRPDDASPTAAGVTGLRGAAPAAAAARDCGGSAPDVDDKLEGFEEEHEARGDAVGPCLAERVELHA